MLHTGHHSLSRPRNCFVAFPRGSATMLEALDKSFVVAALRCLLDGENPDARARAGPAEAADAEPGSLAHDDEAVAVAEGRASASEVARIQRCKYLWDLCADAEVAAYLCDRQLPNILQLVLANAENSVRYCEVAIGALANAASVLGDAAPALHSSAMQELVVGRLLASADPFVVAETLRFLCAVTLSASHRQAWLQRIGQTVYTPGSSGAPEAGPTDAPTEASTHCTDTHVPGPADAPAAMQTQCNGAVVPGGADAQEDGNKDGTEGPPAVSLLQHLVEVVSNTLNDDVMAHGLNLLLHVMYYHRPSVQALVANTGLVQQLQSMWPDLRKGDGTRETVLDICELLVDVDGACAVAQALLDSAEEEEVGSDWE